MFAIQPPAKQKPGFSGFLQSCYKDPFKWDIIKSWSMFAFGVYLSKEICSIDFTSPPALP
ncbi:hypothetical protein X975_13701, partial [Stegodyphus mimosarum]